MTLVQDLCRLLGLVAAAVLALTGAVLLAGGLAIIAVLVVGGFLGMTVAALGLKLLAWAGAPVVRL